jgi:retina and anterior neural fold homeobox protein
MEAARLGLSEYPMTIMGRPGVSHMSAGSMLSASGLALPMDPWLSPPLLNSQLSHALPSFLTHSHNGYPSYLTPPASAPPSISSLMAAATIAAAAAASAENKAAEAAEGGGGGGDSSDPRSSSIAALRLKAKEHVESLTKGLQMV